MDADRNPMTSPNMSPVPPSHRPYSNLQTADDSRHSFTQDDFGIGNSNTTMSISPASSNANLSFFQSTQAYSPIPYHHQGPQQRHHTDYSNQPHQWPEYAQYQEYQPNHFQQGHMQPPRMRAPTPPPPQIQWNQGVQLTDLSHRNRPAATNTNEPSEAHLNDRVLKCILESEAVKEVINNMCKAAVEAAINDIKESLPEPKESPMVCLLLLLFQHTLTAHSHINVTFHNVFLHFAISRSSLSPIKYMWHKGDEFLKNPDGLILDHRNYCQTVRTLISKSLQWFKENYDEDGHRLAVGKKHTRRSNVSVNEESSAHNGSQKGNKRSRRSNSTASNRNGRSDASQTHASSDDGLIDPNGEVNSSQEGRGQGTSNTNSSTGLRAGYSGSAIPIPDRPEAKAKPPPHKSVPITPIEVPAGYGSRAPQRSRQRPKDSNAKPNPSTCNSRRSQPNSSKGASSRSQGHSSMSSKNCGRLSGEENIVQRTSKGKENKASHRTAKLKSPISKRPSSTSSRPEERTPEAARTKAQRQLPFHESQSESQYTVYTLSQDLEQDLDPLDPLLD